MIRVEHSVIIKSSIENVFVYASDWRKWHEWYEGVNNFTPTTQVTEGNGARYAYKARMMGIWMEIETEIHDFVQNQGWRGVSTKGIPATTYWVFEPFGQDTKFTHAIEYETPMPLLGPLVDKMVKKQWEGILSRSLSNLQKYFQTS